MFKISKKGGGEINLLNKQKVKRAIREFKIRRMGLLLRELKQAIQNYIIYKKYKEGLRK